MQNNSKSFSPIWKWCFNVSYSSNYFCNTQVKIISSNIFLSSIVLNIFLKPLPSTTVIIRELRLWHNKSNISFIFCRKPLRLLEGQMSEDKSTPLLAIKKLLFCLSSFLHIAIFLCTTFILYKCNYKSLTSVIGNDF